MIAKRLSRWSMQSPGKQRDDSRMTSGFDQVTTYPDLIQHRHDRREYTRAQRTQATMLQGLQLLVASFHGRRVLVHHTARSIKPGFARVAADPAPIASTQVVEPARHSCPSPRRAGFPSTFCWCSIHRPCPALLRRRSIARCPCRLEQCPAFSHPELRTQEQLESFDSEI